MLEYSSALPKGLVELTCSSNSLISLPELPNTLITLDCKANNLIELPKLPNGLKYLNCAMNPLTKLPELPSSLHTLTCYYTAVTSLPPLPDGLAHVYYQCSGITEPPVTKQYAEIKTFTDAFLNEVFFDREDAYYEHLTRMGATVDDTNILTLSNGKKYRIGLFEVEDE